MSRGDAAVGGTNAAACGAAGRQALLALMTLPAGTDGTRDCGSASAAATSRLMTAPNGGPGYPNGEGDGDEEMPPTFNTTVILQKVMNKTENQVQIDARETHFHDDRKAVVNNTIIAVVDPSFHAAAMQQAEQTAQQRVAESAAGAATATAGEANVRHCWQWKH